MPILLDYDKCCYRDGECQECACKKAAGKSKCDGCAEACATGALVRGPKLIEYAPELCNDCGLCIDACKYAAIQLVSSHL